MDVQNPLNKQEKNHGYVGLLWLIGLLVWPVMVIAQENNGGTDPHNLWVMDRTFCQRCHQPGKNLPSPDLKRPCDPICVPCHKDREAHHPTRMVITFDVSPQIRLTPDKRMVCITCHDLSLPRFSDIPRKAQSLFQRLFQQKKVYKSYYLFMDNRKGQLCKQCH